MHLFGANMNLKDNDNLLQQILHDDTLTDEALNIIKMKINIQKAKEMHPYPIHYSERVAILHLLMIIHNQLEKEKSEEKPKKVYGKN